MGYNNVVLSLGALSALAALAAASDPFFSSGILVLRMGGSNLLMSAGLSRLR